MDVVLEVMEMVGGTVEEADDLLCSVGNEEPETDE